MKLSGVIQDLIKAQDDFDSIAYAKCFSDDAIVFDEGNTYKGKQEIETWISSANEKYHTVMKPLEFSETKHESILTVELSGSFPGSPIVVKYHFEIHDNKITSLKVV